MDIERIYVVKSIHIYMWMEIEWIYVVKYKHICIWIVSGLIGVSHLCILGARGQLPLASTANLQTRNQNFHFPLFYNVIDMISSNVNKGGIMQHFLWLLMDKSMTSSLTDTRPQISLLDV